VSIYFTLITSKSEYYVYIKFWLQNNSYPWLRRRNSDPRWFLESIANGFLNLVLIVFSDDACFTLSADVRSQNDRYCYSDNPDEVKFYCVILYSESGVQWVRAKNSTPVYFKEANFDRYCKLIPTSVLGS